MIRYVPVCRRSAPCFSVRRCPYETNTVGSANWLLTVLCARMEDKIAFLNWPSTLAGRQPSFLGVAARGGGPSMLGPVKAALCPHRLTCGRHRT